MYSFACPQLNARNVINRKCYSKEKIIIIMLKRQNKERSCNDKNWQLFFEFFFMQIRCNLPHISYLSDINYQFLSDVWLYADKSFYPNARPASNAY